MGHHFHEQQEASTFYLAPAIVWTTIQENTVKANCKSCMLSRRAAGFHWIWEPLACCNESPASLWEDYLGSCVKDGFADMRQGDQLGFTAITMWDSIKVWTRLVAIWRTSEGENKIKEASENGQRTMGQMTGINVRDRSKHWGVEKNGVFWWC